MAVHPDTSDLTLQGFKSMSDTAFDVIVLGSGMAGASVAAELAQKKRRVLLLEVEEQAGMHATARSAAMYLPTYGNATVRALTRASRDFFTQPPEGFTEHSLVQPRSVLFVADNESLPRLAAMAASLGDVLQPTDVRRALEIVPILRPERVAWALLDDTGSDIDVAAMHQGYLRVARQGGAKFLRGAGDVDIERRGVQWRCRTAVGAFEAPILVNATGAWADRVAQRAGLDPVGLQPLRRSAVLVAAPQGLNIDAWPLTMDVDETVYFKPYAGNLLLSPANEDPSEPCDAMPEELDIALAVDRFEALTSVTVTRPGHRWAGLRSFVADRSPVVGYDKSTEGFFWLAGQGGYGIQMAPALARVAARLIVGESIPSDMADEGVMEQALSPGRPGLRATP
jgi:D-arginine dehydrogenase